PQDWVKIRGDQLVPRDGYYDIRVNANLWETHFFDHMALIVADHPPGTEIFVDEKFSLAPMVPEVYLTTPPRPVAKAWDHHGTDVTEIVAKTAGRYLDPCGSGRLQGITYDHWVEGGLGDGGPARGSAGKREDEHGEYLGRAAIRHRLGRQDDQAAAARARRGRPAPPRHDGNDPSEREFPGNPAL